MIGHKVIKSVVDWKGEGVVGTVIRRLCGGGAEVRPLCCRATRECKLHACLTNTAQEVHALICIIKKGLKELCRYSVGAQPCPPCLEPLVDVAAGLDSIDCKFTSLQTGHGSITDYALLIAELKKLQCCLKEHIETHFCVFRRKVDLVNCLLACLSTMEKKLLMALADAAISCIPCESRKPPLPSKDCPSRMVIKNNAKKPCSKPALACDDEWIKPPQCPQPCSKSCKEPKSPCEKITTCTSQNRISKVCKDAACQAKEKKQCEKKGCEITRMTVEYTCCSGEESQFSEPAIRDRINLDCGYVETGRRDIPGLTTYTIKAVVQKGGLDDLASQATNPSLKGQIMKMLNTASSWYRSGALLYENIKPSK